MKHTPRRRATRNKPGISASDAMIEKVRKALDLAETDPEKFRAECRKLADKLGVSLENLYQMVQHDPRSKRAFGNFALQNGVKLARRVLGI